MKISAFPHSYHKVEAGVIVNLINLVDENEYFVGHSEMNNDQYFIFVYNHNHFVGYLHDINILYSVVKTLDWEDAVLYYTNNYSDALNWRNHTFRENEILDDIFIIGEYIDGPEVLRLVIL